MESGGKASWKIHRLLEGNMVKYLNYMGLSHKRLSGFEKPVCPPAVGMEGRPLEEHEFENRNFRCKL